ncbi:MAG: replicative DNA helicase [Candidatus Omnitrophica bacterium]|nr:replicative DNA helicase [Candidatus Omnitrophota bacterium]MDD5488203.1 replicative DNA helicase [Candidatus Omnitrophota bacterium]
MIPKTIVEKVPPQNVEAEIAVLGSMLIDRDAISRAVEFIGEASFYLEAHKRVFSSIVKLYDSNNAVDIVTLTEELQKKNHLDGIGGPAYISSLANSIPTAANVEHYAKIVRDKHLLRKLINTATQIVTEGYDPSNEVDDLLDKAEKLIFDITSNQRGEMSVLQMKDIVKDTIETIDNLYQRKENITGIPTGFHDLDVKLAGLQKSDLIVLAGRPSMGKSALALSILEYAGVVAQVPSAYFSLEMSKEQLAQRMLCSIAGVNAHKVRTGFFSQNEWPKLVDAAGKLSESPIYIDDTPGISALELRAKARRLKSRYNIQLLIIDYIQLMKGASNIENRQQEISDISRSMKALARELDIPIIGISQLSRAVEQRADHRPMLSDLRESGAIEQDADVVMLLLREEYYAPTEENKGKAEVIIAKQRHGPVGSVMLAFLPEFTKFGNLSRIEEEEGF